MSVFESEMESSEPKPLVDLIILVVSIVATLILFAIIRCSLVDNKKSTATPTPTQINLTIIQLGSPQPATEKVPLSKVQKEPSSETNMFASSNNLIAAIPSAAETVIPAVLSGDFISKITCWVLFVLLLLWIALNAFSSAVHSLYEHLRGEIKFKSVKLSRNRKL